MIKTVFAILFVLLAVAVILCLISVMLKCLQWDEDSWNH